MVKKFLQFFYLFFFSYSLTIAFGSSSDPIKEDWEEYVEEEDEEESAEERVATSTYFNEKSGFALLAATGALLALWPDEAPVKQRRHHTIVYDDARFELKRGEAGDSKEGISTESSSKSKEEILTHSSEGFTLRKTSTYREDGTLEKERFVFGQSRTRTFFREKVEKIKSKIKGKEHTFTAESKWQALSYQEKYYDKSGKNLLRTEDLYKKEKMNPARIEKIISYHNAQKTHHGQVVTDEMIYMNIEKSMLSKINPMKKPLKPCRSYIYDSRTDGSFSQTDFYGPIDRSDQTTYEGLLEVSFFAHPDSTRGYYAQVIKREGGQQITIIVDEKGKEVERYSEESQEWVKSAKKGMWAYLASLPSIFSRSSKEDELEDV